MMKLWYQVFVLVSLGCLVGALYHADYLRVPDIVSPGHFAGSIVLLFGAFLAATISWNCMLKVSRLDVSARDAFTSMGLSVFGKYVPGKVWAIAGRAAYVARTTDLSLTPLAVASVRTQLIDIWTGLTLGAIALFLLSQVPHSGWVAIICWTVLTVLIFSKTTHKALAAAVRYVLRRDINIPRVRFQQTRIVLLCSTLSWGLLALAFYLFARSVLRSPVPPFVGLAFPLATALGILVVFSPGGLGAREGILTGYLVLAGVSVADATTVAVASRLWFLMGEVTLFVLGGLSHLFEGRKPVIRDVAADARKQSPRTGTTQSRPRSEPTEETAACVPLAPPQSSAK